MTRTIPFTAKLTQTTKPTKSVENMLRDIAMVLHLTQKVKASMVEDRAMPTGGRFAKSESVLEIEECEFSMI